MHRCHRDTEYSSARNRVSRRSFLATGACGLGAAMLGMPTAASKEPAKQSGKDAVPKVDLHVHLDNSTIDEVLALGKKLDVKFGIVEHAGTELNDYPVVLSNDEELGMPMSVRLARTAPTKK